MILSMMTCAVRRTGRLFVPLLGAFALTGCFPDIEVSRHLAVEVDHPRSVIERALAACSSRTETAETACVKRGLADAKLSVAALPALFPGCRTGHECHVDYTTESRIGFVPAVASDYAVRWRVTADLTHPAKTLDAIPIRVEQVW
jgi:hypothetical protein